MIKLAKYLKPYTMMIVTVIVLLFTQAMCNLALPDYMSDIVNKGIQQGGIVNAVPEAIRQCKMDKLTLFMNKKNRKEVLNSYTLIDKSNVDYNNYIKDYPDIEKEPVYVLNETGKSNIELLNPVIGKAFLITEGIEKMIVEAENGVITFNGRNIPSGTDMFILLSKLPTEQRIMILDAINEQFSALDDSMIVQSSVAIIKAEYNEIGINTDKIQNSYIINIGIIMLLISLLSGVCDITVGLLAARTAAGTSRDLRRSTFVKIENFSGIEFDKFSTASLITRTTNDITQIQMLIIIMMRMVFFAPIMGIGGVIRAIGKSPSMSWIIGLAVLVLLGLILIVFSVAMPKFKLMQKLVDRINLVTRENLSGMMVIRAFNTQKFEEDRFDRANIDLAKTTLFVNRVMVVMMPAMMLIMNGITLLIVWIGAHHIAASSMQVGDMMAFMQYAMQIIFSFLMLSMMFIMLPRASVSAQRISEVLETEPEIVDIENPVSFKGKIEGIIEFKNVSFRYHGAEEDVLKNISFKALPGQTTAFIGPTGSGKSTIINLIPRFYDVTGGQVLIDGIDIRNLPQHELRDKIGYIPQKSSLFSGTIESNLKYANENASNDLIRESAETAQAMEFIDEKQEGFQAAISQGGSNVSGGQKQRLSIARALVKKPDIFIFDDSFSALDFRTDADLRRALKEQTGESTVLIVAQRISTIMNAEQIIVIDEGRIAGKGKHRELMEKCNVYREIALSQLSKEELA